jgi:hypothetical protein
MLARFAAGLSALQGHRSTRTALRIRSRAASGIRLARGIHPPGHTCGEGVAAHQCFPLPPRVSDSMNTWSIF